MSIKNSSNSASVNSENFSEFKYCVIYYYSDGEFGVSELEDANDWNEGSFERFLSGSMLEMEIEYQDEMEKVRLLQITRDIDSALSTVKHIKKLRTVKNKSLVTIMSMIKSVKSNDRQPFTPLNLIPTSSDEQEVEISPPKIKGSLPVSVPNLPNFALASPLRSIAPSPRRTPLLTKPVGHHLAASMDDSVTESEIIDNRSTNHFPGTLRSLREKVEVQLGCSVDSPSGNAGLSLLIYRNQMNLSARLRRIEEVLHNSNPTRTVVSNDDIETEFGLPISNDEGYDSFVRVLSDSEKKKKLIEGLSQVGGKDVKEVVSRVTHRLLAPSMQRRFNRSGREKLSFTTILEPILKSVAKNILKDQFDEKILEQRVYLFLKDSRTRARSSSGQSSKKAKVAARTSMPPQPTSLESSSRIENQSCSSVSSEV